MPHGSLGGSVLASCLSGSAALSSFSGSRADYLADGSMPYGSLGSRADYLAYGLMPHGGSMLASDPSGSTALASFGLFGGGLGGPSGSALASLGGLSGSAVLASSGGGLGLSGSAVLTSSCGGLSGFVTLASPSVPWAQP